MRAERSSAYRLRTPSSLVTALAVAALLLAIAAIAVFATRDDDVQSSAAIQGSGVAASETRELPAFTAVDLVGLGNVVIGVGGEQLVVVRGDDNLLEIVTTEVRSGTLVIAESESFEATSPLTVEITVPTIDAVSLAGTGLLTVEGHDVDSLAASLSGAGTLRAVGTATQLDVELSGTGDVELRSLVAEVATVTISGAGNVYVHATRSLDATVSGTGTVFYSGDPSQVTQDISGTGAVLEE